MAKTVTVLFVGEEGSGRALLKQKIQHCLKDFNPHTPLETNIVNGTIVDKGHSLSFSTDLIVNKLMKKPKQKQTTTESKDGTN